MEGETSRINKQMVVALSNISTSAKAKYNISVNFLDTPYCLSYIKNRVILENSIFMKFPFLANNKSYSNYLKENGESIKRTKDRSGMASPMKNKGQDWEKLL